MPIRTLATLAIAVFLGIAAVVLTKIWLGNQRQADAVSAGSTATVPVLVAAQTIERGAALQPGALKIVRYPQASSPAGALTSLADATMGGDRFALRPIVANEPILASKVTAPGGKANLSASLTPGMRAVTFRANDVAGVAGFVLPGDRVDVLLTSEAAGAVAGSTGYVTQVLADNLKVLGVDQSDDDSTTKPVVAKAITLEVTPEQAQSISLAQAVGTVSLSLRQVADQAAVEKRVTTMADLGGRRLLVARSAPTARAARRPAQIAAATGPHVNVTRGVITTDYAVAR